jgi:malonate transporter and related proteins
VPTTVVARLLVIFAVIGIGWVAGRTRLLGGDDSARLMSNAAFYLFTPALLFRTTSRVDLATLPWVTLLAFFGPVLGLLLLVYAGLRLRGSGPPAAPSVRAISTTFGNTVQLGIPVVTALFGEAGLTLHITVVSLHALTLLTVLTVLVETDLARADHRARDGSARFALAGVALVTARRTVVHPVVLPVVAGLVVNLARLPVPGPLDDGLVLLAQAVVPVCLVTIGMSLAHYGTLGVRRQAIMLSVGKLVVQPALVFVAARWGAGMHGLPLAVVVLAAGLPIGSNALLFAQRYRTLEAEATAGIVISTLAFTVTGPLWILLLEHA